MKKILGILLASALVLSACGNDEKEKKEEPKKETKTKEQTEKQKAVKKEKAKENKDESSPESSEANAAQNSVETQYSQSSQTEQIGQSNQQEFEEFYEQLPTYEEQMRANAEVAKQHGYTGIPNGDAGLLPVPDYYYSNDQLDPETGLPYEDAVPHKVE
ncbi:hypothetical protein [Staphylococcus rostri]|uniref:Lipoprotein n=1 Tax=Staphylococcus rostri TaxID=522262 RepID=A0A2K3YEW8_9STAP|nr:hypothetical protein [Staphylococcus rostri]PNZ24111.1 hypothetical protein CD122_11605 [Staphylococcus rostri]